MWANVQTKLKRGNDERERERIHNARTHSTFKWSVSAQKLNCLLNRDEKEIQAVLLAVTYMEEPADKSRQIFRCKIHSLFNLSDFFKPFLWK